MYPLQTSTTSFGLVSSQSCLPNCHLCSIVWLVLWACVFRYLFAIFWIAFLDLLDSTSPSSLHPSVKAVLDAHLHRCTPPCRGRCDATSLQAPWPSPASTTLRWIYWIQHGKWYWRSAPVILYGSDFLNISRRGLQRWSYLLHKEVAEHISTWAVFFWW